MLKANELRIGNWIMVVDEDSPVQVTGVWDDVVKFKEDGEIGGKLKPIPITHDILVKCGFDFNKTEGVSGLDESDPEATTYYWDLRVKRNDVYDGEGTLSLVQWGDNKPIYFSNQWLRVKMIYLHQLQNLYFALTNEELTIEDLQLNGASQRKLNR